MAQTIDANYGPAWALVLHALGLAAPPPLPPFNSSQVHTLPDDELDIAPELLPPGIDLERARVLLLPLSDAEAGLLLGVTRQRAWQLRRRLAGTTRI